MGKAGWAGLENKRYELGPVVGTGAFASVHQARDPRLDAPVAVKTLADNWSADPSVRSRFGQEAKLLRRVRSEHRDAPLVEVFDIDEGAGGRPYFVMTYADRGTLKDRMDGTAMPIEQVTAIVDGLAAGMSALHRSGVIHRDLKPSNLLYVSSAASPGGEQLLIGDLGLAKDQLLTGSALTMAGGTPGYMAPEQAYSQSAITPQADIYAASIIVLELLTGRVDLDTVPLLPGRLSSVLQRGTSQTPGERHRSAEEWQADITQALQAVPGPGAVVPGLPIAGASPPGASPGARRLADRPARTGRFVDRVRGWVGGWIAVGIATAVAAALIGGGALLWLFTTDGESVGVRGPTATTVGETIVLIADVPDEGSYTWTVGDRAVTDQDLQITPRSTGNLVVRLIHRDENNVATETTHLVEVTP